MSTASSDTHSGMYIETLGSVIKAKREQRGLSQEKFCAMADLSVRNYRRIEAGTREPDLTTIYKITLALGVHYSDLLEASFIEFSEIS